MIRPILPRSGRPADFDAVESLCARAMLPAYDHPDLSEEQRSENRRLVALARDYCLASLDHPDRAVFVATDGGTLAGFLIASREDPARPEIDWLTVEPEYQGKGIAGMLMDAALAWLPAGRDIHLGVIHYNARAIRFYERYGFRDTGRTAGSHKIRRILMIRPAEAGHPG